MSLLTGGRSTNCDNQQCTGGICASLYLANKDDVASIQVDVDGKVTGITMEVGKVFYPFDFQDETAVFNEELTVENCVTVVDATFTMTWPCRNHADRNTILEMANNCCGMIGIHVECTGVSWIWGTNDKQRIKLRTATGNSGTTFDNPNSEVLVLGARGSTKAAEFTPGEAGIPVT